MDYSILNRILGTVLAYYEINKDVLTESQIEDIIEQKDSIINEMKLLRNKSERKEKTFEEVLEELEHNS